MSTLLSVISLFVLSLSPVLPPASITPLHIKGAEAVIAVPTCYIFTVDNASSYALGTVTISGIASSTNFSVTSSGFYQQEICYTALSCTVAGTSVSYPNTGTVDLGSGTLVKVVWQSASLVEIMNEKEVGSPQP